MAPDVIALLRTNRAEILDKLVLRIVDNIPRYAVSGGAELREHAGAFFDDVLSYVEAGERPGFSERQVQITKKRIEQGFDASD